MAAQDLIDLLASKDAEILILQKRLAESERNYRV